jgi:hypothetical protein
MQAPERLSVEQLEHRICMHGQTAVLADGTLAITGDHVAGDSIAIELTNDGQSLDVIGEHGRQSFPASDVRALWIEGLGGNDLIKLDHNLKLPTYIHGGDGQDTVLGWNAPDRVFTAADDWLLAQDVFGAGSGCLSVECFAADTVEPPLVSTDRTASEAIGVSAALRSVVHQHAAMSTAAAIGPGSSAVLQNAAPTPRTNHMSTNGPESWQPSLSSDIAVATQRSATGGLHESVAAALASPIAGLHAMENSSVAHASVRINTEWSTRSPDQGECPISTPMGASAIASSSSPQMLGGEVETGGVAQDEGDSKADVVDEALRTLDSSTSDKGSQEREIQQVPALQWSRFAAASLLAAAALTLHATKAHATKAKATNAHATNAHATKAKAHRRVRRDIGEVGKVKAA